MRATLPALPTARQGASRLTVMTRQTRFWHGFADMHVVADHEIVMVDGDGALLTDANGKEYIDATAGLWFCNVGYGRREIADAVAAQLTKLSAYSSFGAYTTDASVRVAERLAAMAPIE